MKWTKGQSGNPAGKKPGSGEVAQLREQIKPYMPELLQRMVLQALAGDSTVQRLLLERVFPALKPQAADIRVELTTGAPLVDQGEAILQAIVDGNIAPDVGSQIITALGQLGTLRKNEELEARLRALEGPEQENEDDFGDFA